MNDAREEAIRLAKESGLSCNDYGQIYATGGGAVLIEDIASIIALARQIDLREWQEALVERTKLQAALADAREALKRIINRAAGKTVRVSKYERDIRDIAASALRTISEK